jgi:hypothetical protein
VLLTSHDTSYYDHFYLGWILIVICLYDPATHSKYKIEHNTYNDKSRLLNSKKQGVYGHKECGFESHAAETRYNLIRLLWLGQPLMLKRIAIVS